MEIAMSYKHYTYLFGSISGSRSTNKTANKKPVCEDCETWLYKNRTAFPMSGQDWIDINDFVKSVGWSFLFDVNVLIRNSKNRWR